MSGALWMTLAAGFQRRVFKIERRFDVKEGTDFVTDDLEERNQMSAIAYLWTIELENNGTGLFRKKLAHFYNLR